MIVLAFVFSCVRRIAAASAYGSGVVRGGPVVAMCMAMEVWGDQTRGMVLDKVTGLGQRANAGIYRCRSKCLFRPSQFVEVFVSPERCSAKFMIASSRIATSCAASSTRAKENKTKHLSPD